MTPISLSTMEGNRAAQKWCYNPTHHAKQKHIDVAYHFVREQCTEFKTMHVVPIETDKMLADCCTKSLPQPAFEKFIRIIQNIGDRSLRMTTLSHPPARQTTTHHTNAELQQLAAPQK